MAKPFAFPIKGDYPVSSVGQHKGELSYRGYSIHDLITNDCSYEECVYLILRGQLPNLQELTRYKSKLNSYSIPLELLYFITHHIPQSADGIDVLKMSVSYLGAMRSRTMKSDDELLDSMDELIALMPMILTTFKHRKNSDKYKIVQISNSDSISDQYSIAKRFLYSNTGNIENIHISEIISEEMVTALNQIMILYLEHGITTSAFTARVVTSAFGTNTDLYNAIEAALCAAKGPLHCGANKRALEFMMNYDRNKLVEKLRNKEIVEGFGHRTYMRKDLRIDPRNEYVKLWAERLSDIQKNPMFARPDLYRNATEIEDIMMREKRLFANIDFYGGLAHYQLGIDPSMLVAMICINLCVGWCANIIEQRKPHNKLIRPLSIYTGPCKKPFVPLKSRL